MRAVQNNAPGEYQKLLDEIERRRRATALRSAVPPIFDQLFEPARYKGVHGGRGSAKSWSFGTLALDDCKKHKGLRIVCIREVQKSLEQSVKRLLEDLIQHFDLGKEFRILNTHIETPGGGIIIFQGMQNHTAESIKSLEGYDRAWVEEAQSLSERSLTLLRPTIRKPDSELWFSWNPEHKSDPIDQFLRNGNAPPDSIIFEATYRDNPYLPDVLVKEMEYDRGRDADKYAHVWLGHYVQHSEARVFKNVSVREFTTPADAAFLFGGDWGFANDPTVLLRCFAIANTLYFDQEVWQIGCEIDDTPGLFDSLGCTKQHEHYPRNPADPCEGMARGWESVMDSARPESISYMQRHGYPRMVAAHKGPNSIEEGVKFLKSYDIVVHPRCAHLVDEFGHYSYKKHPLTGVIMPVLDEKKNHTIDSARYAAEKLNMGIEGGVLAGKATW